MGYLLIAAGFVILWLLLAGYTATTVSSFTVKEALWLSLKTIGAIALGLVAVMMLLYGIGLVTATN